MAEKSSESLAPEKLTLGYILVFGFLAFFCVGVFPWLTANVESDAVKDTAFFYMGVGTIGMGAVLVGLILGKVYPEFDFDMPIYSNETAFFKLKKWHILIMMLGLVTLSIFVVMHVASLPQAMIYEAPTFQAVTLGARGSSLLSASAGIVEELFIIVLTFAVTFFLVHLLTKQRLIAFFATAIVTPSAFTLYHYARYSTDVVGITGVFSMALLSTVWILLMRNMLLGIVFHASNNFAVVYFTSISLSPAMVVTDFLLFYVVAYGLIFLWWFTIGRRGDGG